MSVGKFPKDKIIRATRISIAMMIGFAYVAYSGVSNGFWVYITISLVLFDSATIGGNMAKGSSRVFGTFISAVFALLIIIGFANNFIINLIAIICGILLSVYLFMDTKQTYGGLITWTLPVLLINNNDIRSSFLRLFNIIIGALIAYGMHRLFFPARAHNKMIIAMKNTIIEIRKLIEIIINPAQNKEMISQQLNNSGKTILEEINKFSRWQEEAKIEKYYNSIQIDHAVKAYSYMRHLYRLLNVTLQYLDYDSIRNTTQDIQQFNEIYKQVSYIMALLENKSRNILDIDSFCNTDVHYHHYTKISLQEIHKPIKDELDGILANLILFYQGSNSNSRDKN